MGTWRQDSSQRPPELVNTRCSERLRLEVRQVERRVEAGLAQQNTVTVRHS